MEGRTCHRLSFSASARRFPPTLRHGKHLSSFPEILGRKSAGRERQREKWMLDVGKGSPGEITREREQFIFDIIFKCHQCPHSFFLCLLSPMRKNGLAGFLFFCFFVFFLATSCGTWDLSSLPRDQTRTSCIGSAES